MMPLAAYADRLSARPGETIRFHVANATGEPVRASLCRVVCADPNPAGPGVLTEPMSDAPAEVSPPGPQVSPQGSYGIVDGVGGHLGAQYTLLGKVFPTLADSKEQTIFSLGTGSLHLDGEGHLSARFGAGDEAARVRLSIPLALRRWYAVGLSVDTQNNTVSVAAVAIADPMTQFREPEARHAELAGPLDPSSSPLLFGARMEDGSVGAHWNGKLEAPVVLGRTLSTQELDGYARGLAPEDPIAAWDFALEASTSRIVDTGEHALHGRLVNCPGRAMTGSRWTGREMRFRDAPEQYGAIHFHADDLDDCDWPVAYEWTVPDGCRSAIYALVLDAGEASENVPFHVVPPRGTRTAAIAVLASTFTYTIYGNHARYEWDVNPEFRADWHAQARDWGGYPHNPGDHREYGLSTYNDHLDGSGISIASWHRPMLNVRMGYITYPYEALRGSGLRHFPADTHLTAWLEAKGFDYDIITDWELHTEGVELLADYPVVMTGSHPEYHTPAMLEALASYRDGGGRLCYMGGNGFYWKIAANPERSGVIEIRRGEGGIRAWAAEPGEYYNQFDGEYGGMWRRNGRPPQNLTGVGFTAQGNFSGSYYRKRKASGDPRVAWMFEGLDSDVFGDHGLSGHGAAGFELDRVDKHLGTPRHALVVASSENHPPDVPWILVPEEMLTHLATWPGEPAEDLIRADMTFFETPAGGAVFSTGSITFCGSLATDGFDNDVSQLMQNVLGRFLDPRKFEMPQGGDC